MSLTNKEWAKGIERSWKVLADKTLAYAKSVITAPVPSELDYARTVRAQVNEHAADMRHFLETWMEDAQVNRGLWSRVPDKIDRKRGTIKDIQRALALLHTAIETVAEVTSYTDAIFDRMNPDSGWRYEPDYGETGAEFEFALVGMARRLHQATYQASESVSKAVKYISELAIEPDAFVPSEVDVNGIKVVFLDLDTKSKPTDTTARHPGMRKNVLRALDRAHTMLSQKDVGFLWYGKLFVKPLLHWEADLSRYKGLNTTASHAAANYDTRKDIVTMFMDVSDFDVDAAARTIAHELGHRFYYKFMTSTERNQFSGEFGDVPAVSEYGGSNPSEDFAEVFAYYMDGRDLTRQQMVRFRSYLLEHKRRRASPVGRTLDGKRNARILTHMKTPKIAKVVVAKRQAEKLAARAQRVASGEAKELQEFPAGIRKSLAEATKLLEDPFAQSLHGATKVLKGYEYIYRMELGNRRIFYVVDGDAEVVTVLGYSRRNDLYDKSTKRSLDAIDKAEKQRKGSALRRRIARVVRVLLATSRR